MEVNHSHSTTVENSAEERRLYKKAVKRVEEIKSFYIHLTVYILVNFGILLMRNNFSISEIPFTLSTFTIPFLWGIGVFCHWASVFGLSVIWGKSWEDKKIKELMDSERTQHEKWE